MGGLLVGAEITADAADGDEPRFTFAVEPWLGSARHGDDPSGVSRK